jgi:hypothetical protein
MPRLRLVLLRPAYNRFDMSTQRSSGSPPSSGSGLFPSERPPEHEPRSPLPWVVALVVVLVVIGALFAISHHPAPANPGGAGLAPADPYAADLPITNLQMSQAGNMAGSQTTYIDGQISNKGQRTVTGITVQVAFHGFTNPISSKQTMPLMLIRTRQPYVDTEAVSAAPIQSGQTSEFRLIFDTIPQDWDQNYPEIRMIQVTSH